MISIKNFVLKHKKLLSITVCCVLVASIAVTGFVVAWLKDESKVVNSFTRANIDCEIEEKFDGEAKSDVAVRNTSNMKAYIRMKLVANWENEDKQIVNKECSLDDLDIQWNESFGDKWTLKEDGYYYYKYEVQAGESTENIIDKAVVKDNDGLVLNLQVLAEAIQSSPDQAVEDAWGIEPVSNGQLY